MRRLFLILILFSQSAIGDILSDFEGALLNNNTAQAYEYINNIRHGDEGKTKEHVNSYENLVDLFSKLNNFNEAANKYLQTKEANAYRDAISNFSIISNLSGNYKTYRVSQELIDSLNSKITAATQKNKDIGIIYKEDNRKRAEEKELAYQKARAAEDEEYRLAAIEQEKEDQRALAESERRRKLCGKDFKRFYVGMPKKRLLLCMPVSLYAARAGGVEIYQTNDGALITTSNNKVFSWIK